MLKTIEYIREKNYTGLDDIKELRRDFFNKSINVSYDAELDNGCRRVIFTSSKNLRSRTFDQINTECNGLILEAPQWKPLVIPLPTAKSQIDASKASQFLKQGLYNIYKVQDGSVINLYYYDKWTVATARGIDMNNCVFNNKSYFQMLTEILERANLDFEKFTDGLDKKVSYSFGFKHPDMHPFREGTNADVYKIWFIQSVNSQGEVSMESPLQEIPPQVKLEKMLPIKVLFKNLKAAYNNFVGYQDINYGYILRCEGNYDLQDYSMVLLESSLMNYIRNLCYNSTYSNISREIEIDYETVILLSAYLSDNKREVFLNLFPQYEETFLNLDKQEEDMIKNVYKYIKVEKKEKDDVLEYLSEQVNKNITINLHDKPLQKIRDIIHNIKNICVYQCLL